MLKELTILAVSLVLMQFVTQTEGCGVVCIRAGVENQVGIHNVFVWYIVKYPRASVTMQRLSNRGLFSSPTTLGFVAL